MPIHFTRDRMKQVLDDHDMWWAGHLKRPLTKVTIIDAYQSEKSKAPFLTQANCTDFSFTPAEVIEAIDAELSKYEFLGDAFPMVNFDSFGPGVLAAMCGAKLDNSSGRVWFFPQNAAEIKDIHVVYDPSNIWSKRIKEIYRAGIECWQGLVMMGFPDLGGVLDVAASFCGSENLLIDMLEQPEEVKRLISEIETAWYAAYDDFKDVLASQGAYTHWSGLLSSSTSYIVQCDLSYMFGNEMFCEFVLNTLYKDTHRLTNTIYHLDGIGELNHLDSILSLKDLNAVQWVYGDGKPGATNWLHIYKRILDANKQIMILGTPQDYMGVMSQIHTSAYSSFELPVSSKALGHELVDVR